ncbi:hypothetical protein GCM10007388_51120 [Pseudoduganella plicata]|uniref:Uncharacterized protein n=1 Tax=Pseudoduganella plicata TaxID=321984 RepID=A0AA87YBW4_9BURK|nr:hypothetical protein GCM10007388_51120 [Pseudoduganella plicata]
MWDRGILPQDSVKLLAEERGGYLEQDMSSPMEWAPLRERIKQFGMRSSNCVVIARPRRYRTLPAFRPATS